MAYLLILSYNLILFGIVVTLSSMLANKTVGAYRPVLANRKEQEALQDVMRWFTAPGKNVVNVAFVAFVVLMSVMAIWGYAEGKGMLPQGEPVEWYEPAFFMAGIALYMFKGLQAANDTNVAYAKTHLFTFFTLLFCGLIIADATHSAFATTSPITAVFIVSMAMLALYPLASVSFAVANKIRDLINDELVEQYKSKKVKTVTVFDEYPVFSVILLKKGGVPLLKDFLSKTIRDVQPIKVKKYGRAEAKRGFLLSLIAISCIAGASHLAFYLPPINEVSNAWFYPLLAAESILVMWIVYMLAMSLSQWRNAAIDKTIETAKVVFFQIVKNKKEHDPQIIEGLKALGLYELFSLVTSSGSNAIYQQAVQNPAENETIVTTAPEDEEYQKILEAYAGVPNEYWDAVHFMDDSYEWGMF